MFPVEEKIGEIKRLLAANKSVVLTAPPGSGKTTCVAPRLLDEDWLGGKKIIMLEPRRLAARNCASFISSNLGERVGERVGYQVRLEKKISNSTKLEILTEGLLAQRLINDPMLENVGLVVFDEFHERSLACDLAFALALEARRALRPDLRLMIMSATLDSEEIIKHIGEEARLVSAQGRMFNVETEYLGDVSMIAAIGRALEKTQGDILCFLPGEGEIRRACEGARNFDALILPLYGALPKEEQDRIFAPSNKRKVILSTSIAETSLTIPGITCVIDSGLMRVNRFSPATGMSGLVTLPLTLDRAEQRRGRAGRLGPGICYRLWQESANASRSKKMMPEILEADLCSLVLSSVVWGARRRLDLPWLTPPAASAWDQAVRILKSLGALDDEGAITPKGEEMAKKAVHPRLANMLTGAGNIELASLLAAIIEEGSKSRETYIGKIVDEIRETPNRPYSKRILELARRFSSGVNRYKNQNSSRIPFVNSEGALLALAFPDRIAHNRGNGSFRMVSGRGVYLDREDELARKEFIVCCEVDDRLGNAKVFLASPILKEEIEELFSDNIKSSFVCEWDREGERVKAIKRRTLGQMLLDESQSREVPKEELMRVMLEAIKSKGVENLPSWTKESLHLLSRIRFLSRNAGWPQVTDDDILAALEGFIDDIGKWRELEKVDMVKVLEYIISSRGFSRRELDLLAPQRMEVPTGSKMLVSYDGEEPTVEVRLQECFGLLETPKIAGGKIPIVMTLLSPAHRPIQITKDLAGFWREGYQLVRKDMRGRYPKHYWPEDPLSATPTRRTRPS